MFGLDQIGGIWQDIGELLILIVLILGHTWFWGMVTRTGLGVLGLGHGNQAEEKPPSCNHEVNRNLITGTYYCPKCDEVIKSPFLVELQFIECPRCKENVTVQDVVVETKAFTMQRDDLLNRIAHYKGLLREVEKEQKAAGQKGVASKNPKKNVPQVPVRGLPGNWSKNRGPSRPPCQYR